MLCPAHSATRHRTIESPILVPAWSHSPSFIRFSVCRLNDEKMVYPPQIRTIANCRADEHAYVYPWACGRSP
jgi:hypothetical protein